MPRKTNRDVLPPPPPAAPVAHATHSDGVGDSSIVSSIAGSDGEDHIMEPSQWPIFQAAQNGGYPGSEAEVEAARKQMVDAAQKLAVALRNAAKQCDSFIKVVGPSNGAGGASTSFGGGVNAEFLSLAGGSVGPQHAASAARPRVSSGPGRKPMSKEEKAEQRRIRKATRDPTAPKRPPSAYILFQNEVREEMRARHPGMHYQAVLGKVSEAWKGLSEEQRKVYHDKTADAMAKWNSERIAHGDAP